jgi:hypothetical protein
MRVRPGEDPPDALEFGAGRQWNIVGATAVLASGAVVGLAYERGVEWWLSLLLAVAVAYVAGSFLLRQWRWRAKGALVRIDGYGLAVSGGPRVPWGDIAAVERTGRDEREGVVFVARPGVAVPPPPARIPLLAVRPPGQWGSQVVFFPALLDVSAEGIMAAVHHFGDGVPVRGGGSRDVSG